MSEYSPIFNHAARILRIDYPEASGRMVLVDRAAPDTPEKIARWDASLPASDRAAIVDDISPDYLNEITYYPGDFAYVTESAQSALIAVSSASSEASQTMRMKIQECLFHEAGHFITKEGHKPLPANATKTEIRRLTLTSEIAADVFMALTELKYDIAKREGVAAIAERRSLGGWLAKDPEHDTSLALNTLLKNFSTDQIKQMSPQEIADTADTYARRFTPSPQDFNLILEACITAHETTNRSIAGTVTADKKEGMTACLLRLADFGMNRTDKDSMAYKTIANSVMTALNASSSKVDATRKEWAYIRSVFEDPVKTSPRPTVLQVPGR